MDPTLLTVYKSPYPKIRIGKEYDGGYVMVDVPNATYSLLVACGISDDISFEEDFLVKFPESKCIAFDGTIKSLPTSKADITFVNKNIGWENNDSITNLSDIIYENNSIFLKMDIEGGEIPWIKSLSNKQLNKFEQIVIEFHFPFSNAEIGIFEKLNANHVLVHFHPNNCCGVRSHRDVIIPNVFECTYLHKKFFTSDPDVNTELIPNSIDMKNVLYNDEIFINHTPFVN
jgi:hypothetical protein